MTLPKIGSNSSEGAQYRPNKYYVGSSEMQEIVKCLVGQYPDGNLPSSIKNSQIINDYRRAIEDKAVQQEAAKAMSSLPKNN